MERKNRFFVVDLVAGFLFMALAFSASALAADTNPCTEDIAKFCKGGTTTRGSVMDCLERHESELSGACKEYEAKMENARVESREASRRQMRVRQACRDDVSKFCSDVMSGMPALTSCLNAHRDEISGPCGDALAAAKGGEE